MHVKQSCCMQKQISNILKVNIVVSVDRVCKLSLFRGIGNTGAPGTYAPPEIFTLCTCYTINYLVM